MDTATKKRGRAAADGVVIVNRITAKLSLDAESDAMLTEYLEKHDYNFGVAFRAMCRDLRAARTAGGHCKPITTPPAAAGGAGGAKRTPRTQGAARAVMTAAEKKIDKAAARAEVQTRLPAVKAKPVFDESAPGGLLSEFTKEGTRKALSKVMKDRDAWDRGERTPM